MPLFFILFHFYVFSFQLYWHHQDLHSFPTRRSSDLSSRCCRYQAGQLFSAPSDHRDQRPRVEKRPVSRSEEHTSELQSHSDLVCRLLLEKKKQELESLKPRRRIRKRMHVPVSQAQSE